MFESEFDGKINGYEYVDLGLSVKWATCNVGASRPEDYGDLYAWGETKPKRFFTIFNSKWELVSSEPHWYLLNKFDLRSLHVIDKNECLTQTFDTAHQKWGGPWRMPTRKELDELIDINNCKWERVSQRGVEGYKVTGYRTGHSIFLPATGFGQWYGRSKSGKEGIYGSSTKEDCLTIKCPKDKNSIGYNVKTEDCITGMAVRPVLDNAVADGQTSCETSSPHRLFTTIKNILYTLSFILIMGMGLAFYAVFGYLLLRLGKALLFALAVGYALLFGKCKESVSPADGMSANVEYVDLGLSVKWARCNLGADSPYDAGDYFAWGEVTPKLDYSWPTYITTEQCCGTADDPLKEYVKSGKSIAGTECDAATMRLGGKWRMPTWKEVNELFDATKCEVTYYGDRKHVAGYKIKSKINGRSIFLPTVGYRDGTKTRAGFAYQTATYKEVNLNSITSINGIKRKPIKDNNKQMSHQPLLSDKSNAYKRSVSVPRYSFIKEFYTRIWTDDSSKLFEMVGVFKDGKADRCLGLPVRPVLGE